LSSGWRVSLMTQAEVIVPGPSRRRVAYFGG